MTEKKAICEFKKAYKKVDFEAGSYHPLEIAVAVAKMQVYDNPEWTSLQSDMITGNGVVLHFQEKMEKDEKMKRLKDESRSIKKLHATMSKNRQKQLKTLTYYLGIATQYEYAALGKEVKRIICLDEAGLTREFG